MLKINPLLWRKEVGGTSFGPTEKLIRFIGHFDELKALFDGGLSLTKVNCMKDKREGTRTEADLKWSKEFYGSLAPIQLKRLREEHQRIISTAYISCWHRLTGKSDLIKLENEYVPNDFKCVIATSVGSIYNSFSAPDGKCLYLEFLPVRYIDENKRLSDELENDSPRSIYPSLEFKRKCFEYENEARLILHDGLATLTQNTPQIICSADSPKWQYVGINPITFIEGIYPFNNSTFNQVTNLVKSSFKPIVTLSNSNSLLNTCLS